MDVQLQALTAETIPLVQHECAGSVFWELSAQNQHTKNLDSMFEKEAWLATGMLDGVCRGFNLRYDRPDSMPTLRAIATILYCSPTFAPGAAQLPSAPVSDDAWLVSSLHINPVYAGIGLEAVLLDAVIMDAVAADLSALEAFGYYADFVEDPDLPLPPDQCDILARTHDIGLLDVEVLQAAGFVVAQDHRVLPKLRLDLPPARLAFLWRAADDRSIIAHAARIMGGASGDAFSL